MIRFTKASLLFVLACIAVSMGVSCSSDKKKLEEKEKELEELRQLAELDKREMENQYAQYAAQYDEMKRSIKDDSLVTRLDAEQKRAEALLQELKQVKSNSSAEILRLKKELATVRAVLQDYIRQVDSLMVANQTLTSERDEARRQVQDATDLISDLNTEKEKLTEKVAIASQLDATAISITPLKKNGKEAKKSKDIVRFAVSFTIAKNVTTQTGNKTIYVRLMKPNQTIIGNSGTFTYENRNLEYSAAKMIEYTGQETRSTIYINTIEYLSGGNYTAYIFAGGQMIGSATVNIK